LPWRAGFTVLELLVVIAIIVLIMAITFPVGKSLIEGNRTTTCVMQMGRIGQLLKVYYQDWQGVPPRYDAQGDRILDTDENLTNYPANVNTADDYMVDGRGLLALVDLGYLRDTNMLHCPCHRKPQDPADPRHPEQPSDPTYIQSYTGRDNNPAHPARTSNDDAYGQLNQYKYLSIRGVFDPADPDYRRQLSRCVNYGGGVVGPVADPGWHPDDSTVVFWCNWHEDSVTEGGFGQYFVLFWDGSVHRMPNYLFHDVPGQPASGIPPAAWRVSPADDPTP